MNKLTGKKSSPLIRVIQFFNMIIQKYSVVSGIILRAHSRIKYWNCAEAFSRLTRRSALGIPISHRDFQVLQRRQPPESARAKRRGEPGRTMISYFKVSP
jgi:hypothetical protein